MGNKKVFAHEEIETFPDAYETFLEENFKYFNWFTSKVCNSKSINKKPRILILDDAISGFDIDSEIKLYDALPILHLEEL